MVEVKGGVENEKSEECNEHGDGMQSGRRNQQPQRNTGK